MVMEVACTILTLLGRFDFLKNVHISYWIFGNGVELLAFSIGSNEADFIICFNSVDLWVQIFGGNDFVGRMTCRRSFLHLSTT